MHSLTFSLSASVWLQSLEDARPFHRYTFPHIAAVNNSQCWSQLAGKYPTCRHRCCTFVFSHLTGWWAGAHCLISQKEPFSRLLLPFTKSQTENPSCSLKVLSLVSFLFFLFVLLTVWKRFEKQKAHLLCRCTCQRWAWTSAWLLQSWSRRTQRRLSLSPHPGRTSARTEWECWSAGGSYPDLERDDQRQCGEPCSMAWEKEKTLECSPSQNSSVMLPKPATYCLQRFRKSSLPVVRRWSTWEGQVQWFDWLLSVGNIFQTNCCRLLDALVPLSECKLATKDEKVKSFPWQKKEKLR